MEFREQDVRTDAYRDASVHWREDGKFTHLPTGKIEVFHISWDDVADKSLAFERLKCRVLDNVD